MQKLFLILGAIMMALGVMIGAFGAHGLKNLLSEEMMKIFSTGVQYHFYHAIGLFIVGITAQYLPNSSMLYWSGILMVAGIIIFSGSLYLLSTLGLRWLGAITPVGGICFILSWLLFAIAAWKGF